MINNYYSEDDTRDLSEEYFIKKIIDNENYTDSYYFPIEESKPPHY